MPEVSWSKVEYVPGTVSLLVRLRVRWGGKGAEVSPSLVSPSAAHSPWVQEPGRKRALTHVNCAGYETPRRQGYLYFLDTIYNTQWQMFIWLSK